MIGLALAAFCLFQDKPDEEAKKRIEEFRAKAESAKPADRPACLQWLGELKHTLVIEELGKWLAKPEADVRAAAARELAAYKDNKTLAPKACDALIKGIKTQREPEATQPLFDAILALGWKGAIKPLLPFFTHERLAVQTAAVRTVGRLKTRDAIPPLIALVAELEKYPEKPIPTVGQPPPVLPESDKRRRKDEILPAAVQGLRDVTGQMMLATAKEFTEWWGKNARTFKDPE